MDTSAREFVLVACEEYAKSQKEHQFFSALTSEKSLAYEANLTTDDVTIYESCFFPETTDKIPTYSKMIEYLKANRIHENFVQQFEDFTNPAILKQAYLNGWGQGSLQYQFKLSDNSSAYLAHSFVIICDHATGNMLVRGYIEDITAEREQLFHDTMLLNSLDISNVNTANDVISDLIFKAEHDQLTRVYNKLTFEYRVSRFLESDESKNANHGFLMIDLDYFKNINDEFGHSFGDVILSKTATRFTETLGKNCIVGRIGGDEFAAFVKNIDDQNLLNAKAKALCDNLKEEFVKGSKAHILTVSIGVSYFPKDGLDYNTLFEKADIALYDAKKKGKNRYALYQEGMVF